MMTQRFNALLSKNQRFLPVAATVVLFAIAYGLGAFFSAGMRDVQVFLNLFITTPFLLISVVGETFVIISGGIDLSVSGVIALTTTASAALLAAGWNPWLVMVLMLLMGMALGAIMGGLITYLKVQPFIVTLAGMWFARGLCYIISDSEIRIYDRVYKLLAGTRILIPGLSDVVTKKGDYITPLVVVMLLVFGVALYVAHYTRFGRTVYAMGGNNGANEQSARLMGLPVDRTKVLVYTLNGFCSALAGIAYSIYVGSGHGTHATGMELTVIAAVVIGGTVLTGGEGYVFGALFGVLITVLIQTLIQFNGNLSSWWTSIAIGVLMLVFIGMQSLLANLRGREEASRRLGGQAKAGPAQAAQSNRRLALFGGGSLVLLIVVVLLLNYAKSASEAASSNPPTAAAGCQLKAFRQDQASTMLKGGAVIVYERNGGAACVDDLYGIYPDGKIVADDGSRKLEKQVTPDEVQQLLATVDSLGWFTDNMYSTSHTPCGQCYTYFISVSYKGQDKTIQAVDGGTDAPANYWLVSGHLTGLVPSLAAP